MRYHYDLPTDPATIDWYERRHMYGEYYNCNHPVYDECTLFKIGKRGLAVIQQYKDGKQTYWGCISPVLNDQLYLHKNFKKFFDERAGLPDKNGLYPTVTVRQIMHALKMKPLKKERWETCFDRRVI